MADITVVHDCDIERRDDPTALHGDFRDCCFEDVNPDYNLNGTGVLVGIAWSGEQEKNFIRRGLVLYDLLAFIPAGATITAAVLWFYVTTADEDEDHSFRLVRIRRHDWVEDEATWNSYKTGSAWTTAGAEDMNNDRDPAVAVTLGAITTTGWKNYNVLTLASDAWDNRGGICTFIMERYDNYLTVLGEVYFHAKEYRPYDVWGPHHLRITYTLDSRTFQTMVH